MPQTTHWKNRMAIFTLDKMTKDTESNPMDYNKLILVEHFHSNSQDFKRCIIHQHRKN